MVSNSKFTLGIHIPSYTSLVRFCCLKVPTAFLRLGRLYEGKRVLDTVWVQHAGYLDSRITDYQWEDCLLGPVSSTTYGTEVYHLRRSKTLRLNRLGARADYTWIGKSKPSRELVA